MLDSLSFEAVPSEDFDEFATAGKAAYAQDMVTNGGLTPAEATAKAERDFAAVLSNGVATPGHVLSFIVDRATGQRIGRLWFEQRPSAVYLYAIWLDESVRGRGLGRQVMTWLEEESVRRGVNRIDLNVFGGNHIARRLYTSLGFREFAVSMRQELTRR